MDIEIIGKVSATEKNPSTIDEFYFWTKSNEKLSPFDVVKVNHLDDSITYGVIQSISHVTDSASHLSSFISSDFGSTEEEANGNSDRLSFNYIKANVVLNTKNIYTPVQHNTYVKKCNVEDIKIALGLDKVQNPLCCGYLEMYGQRVGVNINTNFLVGPDGAHLNISGISGLACKTSYCMFLLNALQQKQMKNKNEKSIAFVIFNVKGQDLLSIDREGRVSKTDQDIYTKDLGLDVSPFKNVAYYYPYSKSEEQHNINSYANWENILEYQNSKQILNIYKYTYEDCKEKLGYLFANEEKDSSSTMESIITYIENERKPFANITQWKTLQKKINDIILNKEPEARLEIAPASWKKFKRIIDKILNDDFFAENKFSIKKETSLSDAIHNIKPNEVKVIDIARLDEKSQAFVFGDVVETLHDMMSSKSIPGMPDKIIVFVDELNKYASTDASKNSPILKQLLEISERGRSLGLILFSVEQFRSSIHDRVKGNCATSAFGRSNFVEVGKPDYRYFGETYKGIITRLSPGEYIISNPALRSLINIKFPRPVYRENKS